MVLGFSVPIDGVKDRESLKPAFFVLFTKHCYSLDCVFQWAAAASGKKVIQGQRTSYTEGKRKETTSGLGCIFEKLVIFEMFRNETSSSPSPRNQDNKPFSPDVYIWVLSSTPILLDGSYPLLRHLRCQKSPWCVGPRSSLRITAYVWRHLLGNLLGSSKVGLDVPFGNPVC